ncbi:MAG TPA: response regulator [Polyangiaceae bacterium]|nr:response regulator [Polyangiaceae bacterium]
MAHVLIVDDDPDILEALEFALQEAGYQTEIATNGREAMDRLVRGGRRPALILLDMLMPVMDGVEFLAAVRQRPSLAQIPVLVISAASTVDPPPGTRVLQKPLSLDHLLEAVRQGCAPIDDGGGQPPT